MLVVLLHVFRGLGPHRLVLVAVLLLAALPAAAQQNENRNRLDNVKAEFGQIDATMQRKDLGDDVLQNLRDRIDPLQDELRRIVAGETPRLAAAKTRLDQLGAVPDPAKGPAESA